MLTFAQEVVTVHSEVDEVFAGYLEAALYYSCDDNGYSYSVRYDQEDFLDEDLVELFIDVSNFLAQYRKIVKTSFTVPLSYIGEDLWLSQHHMGEGFANPGYGDKAPLLNEIAKSLKPKVIREQNETLRIVTSAN